MRSFAISRAAMPYWSRMMIGVMALAGLWSSQIVAAPKTDVVVLVNGDHITGEVKQLERGILTYSTDFMGTLKIEWDKVVQLRSDQLLELEMLDGTRTNGRPTELAERGALRLEADRGEPARPIALVSVARIFALDVGRLRDRLDGYVNVGWSAAAANDVSQLSVGAGLTYPMRYVSGISPTRLRAATPLELAHREPDPEDRPAALSARSVVLDRGWQHLDQ